jgi:hypothetical protein
MTNRNREKLNVLHVADLCCRKIKNATCSSIVRTVEAVIGRLPLRLSYVAVFILSLDESKHVLMKTQDGHFDRLKMTTTVWVINGMVV